MNNTILFLLILVPLFSILAVLSSLVAKRKGFKQILNRYKYERREQLFTEPEREFLITLENMTKNIFYIFPQIHLTSLLEHKVVGQNWKGAFSHINGKSVDYVICDKKTLKPLLVIELDDASHQLEDRIERDIEVERILEEAEIPLLRIPYADMNNRELIREHLLKLLA